jgi:alkane 1-monooxygenase
MLWFQLIQVFALGVIYFFFGIRSMWAFMAAALIGVLLLETVNYIEHYGLRRERHENGRYERTKPAHSWNSDHVLGRWMLFELSRHSDHHFIASRKYHLLQYHEQSPQMPTGYPGMMILSLLPPLWFHVMNQLIEKQQFKVVSQDNFEIKGEF